MTIAQTQNGASKALEAKVGGAPVGVEKPVTEGVSRPKRFFATIHLSPLRMASEAGTIGREVIQHLEALLGAKVEVTLEIAAQSPAEGFPDTVVRVVTENARTLKFENFGFEEE